MIDAARALAANAEVMNDAASDLADQVLREIERLDALRQALNAFIEPPEQEVAVELSLTVPAIKQPGSARAAREIPGGPVGTPTPASPLACDQCDRTFDNAQRLGSHRFQAHERQRPKSSKVEHPSRSEKFLCARCQRAFLSRSARDEHETEDGCTLIPTRPPVGQAALGRLSGPTRADGFGQ